MKEQRSTVVYRSYKPPSKGPVKPTVLYGGSRPPVKGSVKPAIVYEGYRPPSVTPGVGRLQTPTVDEDREGVAREKASVDAFRDALRMG